MLGNQRLDWLDEKQLEIVRTWQVAAEAAAPPLGRWWRPYLVPIGVATILLAAVLGGAVFAFPGILNDASATPTPVLGGDVSTPTPTPSPTVTPTPFPVDVMYDINRCETVVVPGSGDRASVDTCVTTISSESQQRLLRVFMTWTAHVSIPGSALQKGSDEGNPNMVLEDSAGNQYFYVDLGGGAKGVTVMYDGDTLEGWFLFPVPVLADPPFALVDKDEDRGVRIGGIELDRPQ